MITQSKPKSSLWFKFITWAYANCMHTTMETEMNHALIRDTQGTQEVTLQDAYHMMRRAEALRASQNRMLVYVGQWSAWVNVIAAEQGEDLRRYGRS